MNANKNDNRNRCYKLLQVGRRELGMDEDQYRLFLKAHGAKEMNDHYSASTMSIGQLEMAIETMKKSGFKVKRKSVTDPNTDWRRPRIKKITAIWCALADAGIVRDRSEPAMQKWCFTLTKKARLEWATATELNDCIEGLKRWAWREKVKLRD